MPCSLHGMVLAKPQRRRDCPYGVMVLPLSPIPMGCAHRDVPMGLSCWEVALKLGQLFVLQHSPAAALGSTELSSG